MLRWTLTILLLVLITTQNACASELKYTLIQAAIERTLLNITYDSSYIPMRYPNGDISPDRGVCTDLIIRSYRKVGVDLQKLIHEDIAENFSIYPSRKIWGAHKPDTNIDHRRVPNLQVFFKRHAVTLDISKEPKKYRSGDIVTWMLPENKPHIGFVTYLVSKKTGNPIMVHNIGAGPKLEDMLFKFKITGHYRFTPNQSH